MKKKESPDFLDLQRFASLVFPTIHMSLHCTVTIHISSISY